MFYSGGMKPPSPPRGDRLVHSISPLPAPPAHDRDQRLRGYLLSMGIRTLCFALAGVFMLGPGWMLPAWICVVAAVLLPYPAVVLANNTNRRFDVRPMTSPHRNVLTGTPVVPEDGRDARDAPF